MSGIANKQRTCYRPCLATILIGIGTARTELRRRVKVVRVIKMFDCIFAAGWMVFLVRLSGKNDLELNGLRIALAGESSDYLAKE